MPIIVKDFSWEETETNVFIDLPLKGVAPNKVDIFSSGQYLKVSYPPYMFEVYLKENINESASKATISSGLAKFKYEKCEHGLWNSLQASGVEDKKFMAAARQKAVEDSHKKAELLAEQKAKEKREQERFALREQMKKDEEEKKKIEEAKENIRKNAAESLERWKQESEQIMTENGSTNQRQDPSANHHGDIFSHDDDIHADDEDDEHENSPKGGKSNVDKKIPSKNDSPKKFSKKVKKKKDVPPPRSSGTIQVSFSHRPFKTPSRESKAPEEEEWLAKMAAAGRTTKTDNNDAVDMEEMNPLWLKDKGSSFYKSGNFVAAINAFTAAIVLDGSIPSLFSNRAACHLQMKQYRECIQDCSSALELLTPPVQANALSRCKALVRRGTAQAQLENYVEGLMDYESAIKLDPKNVNLQEDAEKLRKIIQGN
ncbi:dynein assembly factor 4, axonemal-like [Dendronephthya gigantea]|uniref:dynein assembly factor 4, axonemal-like n=1 Tax=Dendronephthya gigantea TaxID=151771 RepID=UPI00106A41C9|nr:dynein assembly factor 4, axonemal-like [Dendronephthya gigantea]